MYRPAPLTIRARRPARHRHGTAGAQRGCGALHGRAGRDDGGKREDGDGSISRAALSWVDGVGQFLFFLGDCLGAPGSQPWRERKGRAAGGVHGRHVHSLGFNLLAIG